MKLLIAGINGMLGSYLQKYYSQKNDVTIFGASRSGVSDGLDYSQMLGDLTDVSSYAKFKDKHFDAVIHCAAEVDLSLCERDWEHAKASNILTTELLTKLLDFDKFVYISTDSVFDGVSGAYSENDQVAPLNNYALSKFQGEEIVKNLTNYYILRTNIYGFSFPYKKSLFEWAYTELNKNSIISGFENVCFNPLYIGQLAEIIDFFITHKLDSGIYNATSNEIISKYSFLKEIASSFDLNVDLIQKGIMSNDKSLKRPLNTSLNNTKLKSVLSDVDLSLKSGLEMLKKDIKKRL